MCKISSLSFYKICKFLVHTNLSNKTKEVLGVFHCVNSLYYIITNCSGNVKSLKFDIFIDVFFFSFGSTPILVLKLPCKGIIQKCYMERNILYILNMHVGTWIYKVVKCKTEYLTCRHFILMNLYAEYIVLLCTYHTDLTFHDIFVMQ